MINLKKSVEVEGVEPSSYKENINTFITSLVLSFDCTVMGTSWLKKVQLHHLHFKDAGNLLGKCLDPYRLAQAFNRVLVIPAC